MATKPTNPPPAAMSKNSSASVPSHTYVRDPQMQHVFDKLDETRNVMHSNIVQQLENMEKTDVIAERAENLMQATGEFGRGARQLRRKLWWKNMRCYLIMGSLVGLAMLVIILAIVAISGGFKR